MDRDTLISGNKRFVYLCAAWASLSSELNIRQSLPSQVVNQLTLVWSALIFVTSLVKILMKRENLRAHELHTRYHHRRELVAMDDEEAPACTRQQQTNLQTLLLLDYLPNIGSYASLYYGLILVTIVPPLVWRLYLTYYKPLHRHHPLAGALAQQLVHFLLQGPPDQGSHHHKPRPLNHQESQRWLHWVERLLHCNSHTRSSAPVSDTCTQDGPLSLAHRPHNSHNKSGLNEVFRNPIRSNDLLFDYSYQHWLSLVRVVYGLVLFALVVSLPLGWFILSAFVHIMNRFGVPTESQSQFQRCMMIYGFCELAYAYTQAAMFFIFTNIFMGLFYADLTYKIKPIVSSLSRLKSSCCAQPVHLDNIHEKPRITQLKLWAYFDNIYQLDHLVSKYSLVSIVTFVSGLCFAQSYISMNDTIITHGAIATFLANFISFNFLYVLSWRIESQSTKLHSTILSIVARETDFVTKRGWQRTIFGFFPVDQKRTFTMDGQYPLNPRSLLKISFALLTISLLINKLFYD